MFKTSQFPTVFSKTVWEMKYFLLLDGQKSGQSLYTILLVV